VESRADRRLNNTYDPFQPEHTINSAPSNPIGASGLRPSTVSRRMSIVAGFYGTAVIDGLLEHSPAEHVRRPHVRPTHPHSG
jgi:hypothetical protein